jgi:hypothetical protein
MFSTKCNETTSLPLIINLISNQRKWSRGRLKDMLIILSRLLVLEEFKINSSQQKIVKISTALELEMNV